MTPDVNQGHTDTDVIGKTGRSGPKADDVGDALHQGTIAERNHKRNRELQHAVCAASKPTITMCNMKPTETPADRLKQARLKAGFGTASAFASARGIPQPTYTMHEKGNRAIRTETAQRYAEALNVTDAWLLTGKGNGPPDRPGTRRSSGSMTKILELDVRAEGGAGGLDSSLQSQEEPLAEWEVPAELLRAHTTATHSDLRIIRIYGDSMQPFLRPGDRVIVDLANKTPSPPGIFVLWDGLGIVVKRVEFVPYSDPKMVKIGSINEGYETYTKQLSEVTINGRVIARWDWI